VHTTISQKYNDASKTKKNRKMKYLTKKKVVREVKRAMNRWDKGKTHLYL
jgi:hypothetical protein